MNQPAEKTEQAAGQPSDLHEAMEKFREEVLNPLADADKAASASAAPPEGSGGKTEGPAKKESQDGEKSRPASFKFVNDKGESVPFEFTADEKKISEVDPEKVRTYASLGFHASQKLEEVNKEREALRKERESIDAMKGDYEQAGKLLRNIVKAMEDGRLVRVDPKAKPKTDDDAGSEKTEDDGGYVDPDIKRMDEKYKALEAKHSKLAKDNEALTAMIMGERISDIKAKMDDEIAAAAKEFPVPKRILNKEVWQLLADDAKLSPRDAVKLLHDQIQADPELVKALERKAEADAAAEATPEAEKAKDEEPPAPSILSPSATAVLKKEPEKPKFQDLGEAMQAFSRDLAEGKIKAAAS